MSGPPAPAAGRGRAGGLAAIWRNPGAIGGLLVAWLPVRRLAGVRGRVGLLLMVAGIPLMLLSVAIVWRGSRLLADAPRQRAGIQAAAAAGQVGAVLDGTRQFLAGLATEPDLSAAAPSACLRALRRALVLQSERFDELVVLNADGAVVCAAHDPDRLAAGTDAPWFRALHDGRSEIEETLGHGGAPGLLVAIAWRPGGRFAGALAGAVATGALAQRSPIGAGYVWLVDAADRLLPLGAPPPGFLPAPPLLRDILAAGAVPSMAMSQAGGPAAFAVNEVGGLRVLVGTPAARDLAHAREALLARVAGLVLLLAAGLAAVAIGANAMLVQPIKHLSRAVRAWRKGAPFDPGERGGMPLELRELADSFAEATRALVERERQLQRAVEQQELLMQEIHHRVKNNLQIIASLLNLQASRIRLPEAKREFAAARDRVRALATLHRHLYAHGDLHTINMRSFLHELCDQLLTAMGESGDGRIKLSIEAPALQISSDQAVPMALIVTEAVSNSARYAFPGGRSGHIRVALSAEDDRARLIIEDDGIGLPDGPHEAQSGSHDGIGLQLIRGFARQLGGSFTLTHAQGTRYELELSLRREHAAGAEPADASAAIT